jgi:hypothetical protein
MFLNQITIQINPSISVVEPRTLDFLEAQGLHLVNL